MKFYEKKQKYIFSLNSAEYKSAQEVYDYIIDKTKGIKKEIEFSNVFMSKEELIKLEKKLKEYDYKIVSEKKSFRSNFIIHHTITIKKNRKIWWFN